LEFGIGGGARGPECFYDGATRSFKIGLVVLIQYRLWQIASHPASQTDTLTYLIRVMHICIAPKNSNKRKFLLVNLTRESLTLLTPLLIVKVTDFVHQPNTCVDADHSFGCLVACLGAALTAFSWTRLDERGLAQRRNYVKWKSAQRDANTARWL